MIATERLYAISDDARAELAVLDRHVAQAKDRCRAALLALETATRIHDRTGLCFAAIMEAIDDHIFEARDEIRDRIEAADIRISDAEWERV